MRVLDTVWMLVRETKDGPCVIYRCAASAQEVWATVINEELMGTGVTRQQLKAQGYRAKRVRIIEGTLLEERV